MYTQLSSERFEEAGGDEDEVAAGVPKEMKGEAEVCV